MLREREGPSDREKAMKLLDESGATSWWTEGRRNTMATDAKVLDKVFHLIMTRMVDAGQAPHYGQLALELETPVEAARHALRDLMATGHPGWLEPRTYWIITFCPFSNVPNQYRITVDGQQKWFGQ